jgi:hypothetical protein
MCDEGLQMSKQWSFEARFLVKRVCTIEAETKEEAKEKWDDNDWDEGHDSDCSLQDADEPDWDSPDEV